MHPIKPSAEIAATFSITANEYFEESTMAVNVFNGKYSLEKSEKFYLENAAVALDGSQETPGECFWRVSSYIASAEVDDGFNQSEADKLAEKWFWMMWHRDFIPGGRILANAGSLNKTSLNNCTSADPPKDSIESIYEVAKRMARALSLGEGIGVDITNLRPEGTPTNNAARTTSGAVSWADLYDFTTGTIAQCLPGNTLIHCRNGLIPIKDIRFGDSVLTAHNRYSYVIDHVYAGEKEIYEIETQIGIIRSSGEHKFAILNSISGDYYWKEAKELTENDVIMFIPSELPGQKVNLPAFKQLSQPLRAAGPQRQPITIPKFDEEISWFLGNLHGDGWVSIKYGEVSITCPLGEKTEQADKVEKIFEKFGVNNIKRKYRKDSKDVTIRVNNKNLAYYMSQFKISNTSMHVPECVFKSTPKLRAAYIAGLFDADGCIAGSKHSTIRIANSVYPNYLDEVRKLLASLGIISNIYVARQSIGNWRTLYQLSMHGEDNVNKLINAVNGSSIKLSNFTKHIYKKNSRDCKIPREILKNSEYKSLFDSRCWSDNTPLESRRLVSIQTLQKLANIKLNYFPISIKKVRATGIFTEMYDLNVADDHCFVAEGYLVKNSGRRGALLISIKITHPETLKFIKVKSDLSKINNANISLQITDDFMKAVIEDGDWTFYWVNEHGQQFDFETVKARDIMREIASHAAVYAEPGIQYIDTMHRYSNSDTLGEEFMIWSTNACSEQPLDPWSTCVLSHTNWANLPLNSLEAAEKEAEERGYYIAWFLDNVVTKQIVDKRAPLPESHYKSVQLRRIGQGFTGLADYFSKIGISYDSKEAIHIAGRLTRAMTKGAYKRSIEAGEKRGSFKAFDVNKIKTSPFIQHLISDGVIPADFKHLRNVCSTTVAPVGTGNIIVRGWGNGVEPGIGFIYWRRTRISGEYVWYFHVNEFVYELLNDVDLSERIRQAAKTINEMPIGAERFAAEDAVFKLIDGKIDLSLHKFSHEVDPFAKADLMGEVQKYIDSAISVTYNMPESATVEDIEKLFIRCWENDLKGVAIYREDPKNREPIFMFKRPTSYNYNVETKSTPKLLDTDYIVAKRPLKLNGFTETIKAENHKFYFTYNKDEDGFLYEVFCHSNSKEPKVSTEAAQTALLGLLREYAVPEAIIEDQINKSSHQSSATRITRLISLALRHYVPVVHIVHVLEELDVTVSSYIYHLRRGLAQFLPTEKTVCPNCNEDAFVIESGCSHCDNCGYSKC